MSDPAGVAHTLWFEAALLPSGWHRNVRIEISDGRIRSITANATAETHDDRHAICVPGARNVHSHAFQRALAGLTEARRGADSFWSWRETMYAFVQKLDADQLEAITAQAYVEMLESGITRVGEFHYLHHAPGGGHYTDIAEHATRLVQAASDTGIGLTLLPVLYAHGGVGGQPPKPTQQRFVNSLDTYARLLERTSAMVARLAFGRVGVAAHSLRAVTGEELQALLALPNAGPIHIHIAEQTDEVEQWLQFAGCRPIEWLLDHAPVSERWCLVHATHVTEAELERVATSGAVVGLCPITEANLGDGIFPARRFIELGGRFGIGTDSNVLIDVAEELRLLEYSQRLVHRERNVLRSNETDSTGRSLYEAAVRGGATALGETTGRSCAPALAPLATEGSPPRRRLSGGALEVGAIADLVALSESHVAMQSRTEDAWLDSWIFAGAPAVDCVWSAGRKVVSDGRHVHRDVIASRYAGALRRLTDSG